jgi:hypothetical protein
MSFAQVMEDLLTLSTEQRQQILDRIVELDRGGWSDLDDPLSERDKQIIESRLSKHEVDPTSALWLEELERRLGQRTRR